MGADHDAAGGLGPVEKLIIRDEWSACPCPTCGAGVESLMATVGHTTRPNGDPVVFHKGYRCEACGQEMEFAPEFDPTAGAIFCGICEISADDGTPCRFCGRTTSPERGRENSMAEWFRLRNLSSPWRE